MATRIACDADSTDIGLPNRNICLSTDLIPSYDTLSTEYKMDFPEKSLCYVFNHFEYDSKLNQDPRYGFEKDYDNIYNCFSHLNFDVHLFKDKRVCEIMTELESVSRMDHNRRAAFVCFILTHGDQRKLLAYDGEYHVEEVFRCFSYDQCPSLKRKPKLFFIEACGGTEFDSGIPVRIMNHNESMDGPGDFFEIPSAPEFFVAFSSVKDFYSFRSSKTGSVFITILCKCLYNYAKNRDLLHIMTFVNQKLALFPFGCGLQQMSCVWFTLTKLLKFNVQS